MWKLHAYVPFQQVMIRALSSLGDLMCIRVTQITIFLIYSWRFSCWKINLSKNQPRFSGLSSSRDERLRKLIINLLSKQANYSVKTRKAVINLHKITKKEIWRWNSGEMAKWKQSIVLGKILKDSLMVVS